ncbi:MAG TPA: single-stranded DNA-binding protein [Thermoanaerobaculia bacterium]|nr:single-stranded DNA-binding protein [Thermoanaerobaculia bacterium]
MAIQLRLLGSVTDAVRRLTYTPSGKPRCTFGVRVGTIRTRYYLVTAYGTTARFADLYLRTGQRVRIEGAFLRRVPCFEGAVRADTIRHVGAGGPPQGTIVRFVPADCSPAAIPASVAASAADSGGVTAALARAS